MILDVAASPTELELLLRQRESGFPLEHVIGWAEFAGLRIGVGPGVFVPRQRTEFLVRQAADLARDQQDHPDQRDQQAPDGAPGWPLTVVDLCCGSGALGLALLAGLAVEADIELHAADLEPAAVACAAQNLAGRGHVHQGDLFEALPTRLRGRVQLLLANVPYVPTEAIALMPPEARLHEPATALDGGADGLRVMRRVAAQAPEWLVTGGHLLVESSARQVPAALDAFRRAGLQARAVQSGDELEATVIIGTLADPVQG